MSRTSEQKMKKKKRWVLKQNNFFSRRLFDCVNLKVKTEKDGKFGRMLGWISCGQTNINEEMIYRGYAWKYDGKKKQKDLNELLRSRR